MIDLMCGIGGDYIRYKVDNNIEMLYAIDISDVSLKEFFINHL